MNKSLKNLIIYALFLSGLILSPQTARSEIVRRSSVLCSNRNLMTYVAVSTGQFNAAICRNNNSGSLYYVGQNARTNEGIFLSVSETYINNDRTGVVFKAVNGRYTYQIYATCFRNSNQNDWASLSVFDNGRRLRNQIVSSYLTQMPCCNNFFHFAR